MDAMATSGSRRHVLEGFGEEPAEAAGRMHRQRQRSGGGADAGGGDEHQPPDDFRHRAQRFEQASHRQRDRAPATGCAPTAAPAARPRRRRTPCRTPPCRAFRAKSSGSRCQAAASSAGGSMPANALAAWAKLSRRRPETPGAVERRRQQRGEPARIAPQQHGELIDTATTSATRTRISVARALEVEGVERAHQLSADAAAAHGADDHRGADGAFELVGAVAEDIPELQRQHAEQRHLQRAAPAARSASSGPAWAVRKRSPKTLASAAA